MAGVNLYRFSSKEFHNNSGLYYYGFRFYYPTLQRWANRDPIFERGGMSLYGFTPGEAKKGHFG
jgi:RHS repeat-associated protein